MPCLHSSGHVSDSSAIKLSQDACVGNCSDEFEHRSSRIKTRSQELKKEKSC
jgi:hypothetical protein